MQITHGAVQRIVDIDEQAATTSIDIHDRSIDCAIGCPSIYPAMQCAIVDEDLAAVANDYPLRLDQSIRNTLCHIGISFGPNIHAILSGHGYVKGIFHRDKNGSWQRTAGAIIYQSLTGRIPHGGWTEARLIERQS